MRLPDVRRKRATALLYTTTMQNVAWPKTMVQKLNGMSAKLKAERNDMPVMMPGKAIGKMTKSDIVSRPKNLDRATAAAQSVPKIIATIVEIAATRSDSPSASQTSGRPQVTANHFSVNPGGGH